MVKIGLLVEGNVKGVGERGFRGAFGVKGGGSNDLFPHPDELLIWAYPKNVVKI